MKNVFVTIMTAKSNAANANAFVHGKYSITNDGKKLNARMWETTNGKQLVQNRRKKREVTCALRKAEPHLKRYCWK